MPSTATLRFIGGQWRADPVREQQDDLPKCFGAGKIGNGSQTISRTTVADPPLQHTAQSPRREPTAGGPVLDGAYRVDVKIGSTTQRNPITGGFAQSDNENEASTMGWAFHSLCGPTRCVATAAALSEANLQEPKGGAMVLDFRDGRWQQSTPSPQLHNCSKATGDATSDTTSAYSFEPEPDGTLPGKPGQRPTGGSVHSVKVCGVGIDTGLAPPSSISRSTLSSMRFFSSRKACTRAAMASAVSDSLGDERTSAT